jgi:hypothetical protein
MLQVVHIVLRKPKGEASAQPDCQRNRSVTMSGMSSDYGALVHVLPSRSKNFLVNAQIEKDRGRNPKQENQILHRSTSRALSMASELKIMVRRPRRSRCSPVTSDSDLDHSVQILEYALMLATVWDTSRLNTRRQEPDAKVSSRRPCPPRRKRFHLLW